MAKVNTYVYVVKDGYPVLLNPGDDIPEGVEVTNPAVLEESDEDAFAGNQEVEPEVTAEEILSNDAPADDSADSDADEPEAPADEPEVPAEETPEPAPAPRKRTSRQAAASE